MGDQLERGLVGVDIGAANIKCALGVLDSRHDIVDIIATSSVPTMGIRDGKIINLKSLNRAIEEGLRRIKLHSQCEISVSRIQNTEYRTNS